MIHRPGWACRAASGRQGQGRRSATPGTGRLEGAEGHIGGPLLVICAVKGWMLCRSAWKELTVTELEGDVRGSFMSLASPPRWGRCSGDSGRE